MGLRESQGARAQFVLTRKHIDLGRLAPFDRGCGIVANNYRNINHTILRKDYWLYMMVMVRLLALRCSRMNFGNNSPLSSAPDRETFAGGWMWS